MSDTVLVAREGGIATVTLNRPASLNALTRAMWAAVRDTFRALDAEAELRCVVGLSHFETLNENDFRLEADLSGIDGLADANAAPLNLVKSPQWVKSVHFSPKSVGFFIIQ